MKKKLHDLVKSFQNKGTTEPENYQSNKSSQSNESPKSPEPPKSPLAPKTPKKT